LTDFSVWLDFLYSPAFLWRWEEGTLV
jgi:hypothetical protein